MSKHYMKASLAKEESLILLLKNDSQGLSTIFTSCMHVGFLPSHWSIATKGRRQRKSWRTLLFGCGITGMTLDRKRRCPTLFSSRLVICLSMPIGLRITVRNLRIMWIILIVFTRKRKSHQWIMMSFCKWLGRVWKGSH